MSTLQKKLLYNYNKQLHLIVTPKYLLRLREDQNFVPRFTLKDKEIFSDFPINEPVKYSPELILKAIQWGMIIQIDYKGEKDDYYAGHERTIYPMVLGFNKENKPLLRAWHFNGWSVSNAGQLEKEWRLFRCDRILSMKFTGSFFRLAPEGYVMRDKQMTRILGMADFVQIRNNQQTLLDKDKVDQAQNVVISKINKIVAKDMNYMLKTFDPYKDNVINKTDASAIRITFAKPVTGNNLPVAILGKSVEPNNNFKLYDDSNNLIGTYRSIKYTTVDKLKDNETIDGKTEFKLFLFKSGK